MTHSQLWDLIYTSPLWYEGVGWDSPPAHVKVVVFGLEIKKVGYMRKADDKIPCGGWGEGGGRGCRTPVKEGREGR